MNFGFVVTDYLKNRKKRKETLLHTAIKLTAAAVVGFAGFKVVKWQEAKLFPNPPSPYLVSSFAHPTTKAEAAAKRMEAQHQKTCIDPEIVDSAVAKFVADEIPEPPKRTTV